MAVTVGETTKRVGLALSGGGFRAAAFHLGAMSKLRERGLLDKIDVLSCVSGGSIAGAFVALNWGEGDVLERLETYLTTRSISVSTFLWGLFDPFKSRLDKLAKSYDDDLFHGATLDDLRAGPRIYFNTTNLATANPFYFIAGGGKKEEMGEHHLKYASAKGFRLSRAVAASSAFPPVYPPLRLDRDEYRPSGDVEYVTLTDGGVYDNLGVNPLFVDANELDYMLVSDAGKPFEIDADPSESGAGVLAATIPIMMEQIRGLEFERMKARHAAGDGPKPLWFSVDSHSGEAIAGDAERASEVDTDLRRLKAEEMEVLKRHGAALVQARLQSHGSELLAG